MIHGLLTWAYLHKGLKSATPCEQYDEHQLILRNQNPPPRLNSVRHGLLIWTYLHPGIKIRHPVSTCGQHAGSGRNITDQKKVLLYSIATETDIPWYTLQRMMDPISTQGAAGSHGRCSLRYYPCQSRSCVWQKPSPWQHWGAGKNWWCK